MGGDARTRPSAARITIGAQRCGCPGPKEPAMSTSLTSVVRPKPGRLDDSLGMIAEVAKLLERHGSADNRALVGGIAGEETGSLAFTSEFATGEQLGATIDALLADPEYQ